MITTISVYSNIMANTAFKKEEAIYVSKQLIRIRRKIACVASVSVGFSARSRHFSFLGGAKIGASAKNGRRGEAYFFALAPIALFTVTFSHLHYNDFERGCEAISGNFALFSRNCLTFTFNYIVMQMRKVNCEKGYFRAFKTRKMLQTCEKPYTQYGNACHAG